MRRQVPPKRRFLQEPHGVTSQKTPFFNAVFVYIHSLAGSWTACDDRVDKYNAAHLFCSSVQRAGFMQFFYVVLQVMSTSLKIVYTCIF
jgi:hypothetical protein